MERIQRVLLSNEIVRETVLQHMYISKSIKNIEKPETLKNDDICAGLFLEMRNFTLLNLLCLFGGIITFFIIVLLYDIPACYELL